MIICFFLYSRSPSLKGAETPGKTGWPVNAPKAKILIPDRKWCFFIFERLGHVFFRKSFVESLVRSVHVLVKTRLSRFFLGNLKETERCFLGLACYLPLGGTGGSPRRCIVLVVNLPDQKILIFLLDQFLYDFLL